MKKVLFATTALVASAGVASAQDLGLSISGFAEIGIAGGSGNPAVGPGVIDPDKMRLHNDIGIQIDGVGETDNGLSFGMSFEIDDANGSDRINGGFQMDNEFAFISSGPVTFSMGEINGALDQRVDEASWGGSLTDDHTAHTGFNATGGFDSVYDNQIARLDYDMGAFGASLSVEQDDTGSDLDPIWGIGVSYTYELTGVALDFGAGYQSHDETNPGALGVETVWGASIGASFDNGFNAVLNYQDTSTNNNADASIWTIGVNYAFNNFSVEANYGQQDIEGAPDPSGFGLAAQYDFGGGLEAQFGYGSSDDDVAGTDNVDTYSLGLVMSF